MVVLCDDVPSTISTFDVAGECVMLMCEPFTPTGAAGVVLLWIWLVFTVLVLPAITVLEVVSPPFTLLPPLIVLLDIDCVDTTVLFPPPA